MNDSIPVIGTAVVNNTFWIQRLFFSIDYHVDTLFIVNNGGRQIIDEELDNLAKTAHPFIKRTVVCHLPSNIGCSGAWNLIIKCFTQAPFWIIVNDDVCFSPGLLADIVVKSQNPDYGIVYAGSGWDLFLIKDWLVQKNGLFDENYYPAYHEDEDYQKRMYIEESLGVVERNTKEISTSCRATFLHGPTVDYGTGGCQTMKSEDNISPHDYKITTGTFQQKMFEASRKNGEYLQNKWAQMKVIDDQIYVPLKFMSYDLNFIREKYTGF